MCPERPGRQPTLALFDLDHTLIPFDSGMAWTRHLVQAGHLPPEAEDQYLAYCHQYVAGTLDLRAMHRASFQPLRSVPVAQLTRWAAEFELAMARQVPASRRALVQQHLRAGHLCAIVTATTRLVAQPLARLFGVPTLLCTEAEWVDGHCTGEIVGEPCFRAHKLAHVKRWLAGRGLALADFRRSHFYSDSRSDLPLLLAVSHPVAVDPDPQLRAHAKRMGWPVLVPA